MNTSATDLVNLISTLPDKSMKMEYFSQNRIVGSIGLNKPSVVFFSIPFDIGWKAKVDDVKSELFLADIGFTGLYVEPGKHVIELYYDPPLSKIGWLGFFGAFALGFVIYRYKDQFWK